MTLSVATAATSREATAVAGLTTAQARKLFATVGPNEPAPPQRVAALLQLLRFFANPLVIILLIAAVVCATLGEAVDAAIIIVMVLLSAALHFTQSYRSQRSAERLRQSDAPTVTALRDGAWGEFAYGELVPGDLIRLTAGDMVPADAQLLESRELHVNRATLTGESMPTEKEVMREGAAESAADDPDAPDLVFLGASVVSGSATALVTATGPRTAFGCIAAHLRSKPPETDFERGTRRFGLLIMETVAVLVLFVFLFSIVNHQKLFELLLFATRVHRQPHPRILPDDHDGQALAGRLPHGATQGHRQAPRVHPELRQHGCPVQRQVGHDHQRRHASRSPGGPGRHSLRSAAASRLPQQRLRDRHPQPARLCYPQRRRAHRGRLDQARRDAVRLRAPTPRGGAGASQWARARLQGRAGERPRRLQFV